MNVTAPSREEDETKTDMKKAGERKSRPIVKKLCAALLRSFREKHGEKMVGGERPGYLEPSGWSTAISTQPKRGRGPHHHVKAAVDWCISIGC